MAGENVLVRFLKRCFIGGGRTVDPGEVAEIPAEHFHPDLHEKVEPPTVEAAAPTGGAPAQADASAATTTDAPQ